MEYFDISGLEASFHERVFDLMLEKEAEGRGAGRPMSRAPSDHWSLSQTTELGARPRPPRRPPSGVAEGPRLFRA